MWMAFSIGSLRLRLEKPEDQITSITTVEELKQKIGKDLLPDYMSDKDAGIAIKLIAFDKNAATVKTGSTDGK